MAEHGAEKIPTQQQQQQVHDIDSLLNNNQLIREISMEFQHDPVPWYCKPTNQELAEQARQWLLDLFDREYG